MAEKDAREQMEKTLGEPFGLELSENSLKIRRNLIAVSTATVFLVHSGAKLKNETTFAGLQFEQLADNVLMLLLLTSVAYMLVEYAWYLLQHFAEWRVRLTGTTTQFVKASRSGEPGGGDFPSDPRQSTLYSWWLEVHRPPNDQWPAVEKIERLVKACAVYAEKHPPDPTQSVDFVFAVKELQNELGNWRSALSNLSGSLGSDRVAVSLKRFDNWFRFCWSLRNARWIILDAALPLVLSGYAIYLLTTSTRLWSGSA